MNLGEFKAWFEGFTENMKQPPSAKAWARIKERVGEITEKPTEIKWIYGGYGIHYWPIYQNGAVTLCQNNTSGSTYQATAGNATDRTLTATANQISVSRPFNTSDVFTALGKVDALALQKHYD